MAKFFFLFFSLLVPYITSAKAGQYQYIYITCVDKYGLFLVHDTIQTEAGQCFFLKAPSIPYYHCKDYSEQGSNVCIHTTTWLTMTYDPVGFSGVMRLLGKHPESLQDDMSFVLSDTEDPTRIWCVGQDFRHIERQTLPATVKNLTPVATWIFRREENRWSIYNEAAGLYVSALTEAGEPLLGGEPRWFSLTHPEQHPEIWQMADPTNGNRWEFTPQLYAPRPYFMLTQSYSDEKGTTIQPDSTRLLPAGSTISLNPKVISGYRFVSSDYETTLPLSISEHLSVHYTYALPTGVREASTTRHNTNIYGLDGRKVNSYTRGLLIREGRKMFVP